MIPTTAVVPSIDLSFPSQLGMERVARDAVAAFGRRFGFDGERLDDLKTAVSEACINAIEHGNCNQPNLRVYVTCSCDGERLTVEIQDDGRKRFQGHTIVHCMDSKLAGAIPRRGMGLMLISQLVDESGFTDTGENGNVFWFSLNRRPYPTAQP